MGIQSSLSWRGRAVGGRPRRKEGGGVKVVALGISDDIANITAGGRLRSKERDGVKVVLLYKADEKERIEGDKNGRPRKKRRMESK